MGADAHLLVLGGPVGLLDLAVERIEQLERRWSRFLPDSEISRLNAAAGQAVEVSLDTTELLRCAVDGWRITGGSFDPLLLPVLIARGYDRTFHELPRCAEAESRRVRLDVPACPDVEVGDGWARLPAGSAFDPGGIGKGLAADLVASELLDAGAAGACVNLGGDVRVIGEGPDGGGWTVAIEHPEATAPLALIGIGGGGVATSSTLRRTWRRGEQRLHHLIDPSTQQPSATDLELASVVAGAAWRAEVLAKAVLLRGTARAFDLLDASTAALIVGTDGAVLTTESFLAFTGGATVAATVERVRPVAS